MQITSQRGMHNQDANVSLSNETSTSPGSQGTYAGSPVHSCLWTSYTESHMIQQAQRN